MTSARITYAIAVVIIGASATATAAEIKVLGGSAVIPVMAELITRFEQSSGHIVHTDFDGAIGTMTDRVRKGEAADVLIVSGLQIEVLAREGKVLPCSRVDLAKVGVGVFVRRGAVKPDVTSVEAFTRAMKVAKSIGYNDPAAGAPVSIYLLGLFERLGMAEEMKTKSIVFKQRTERFEAVAAAMLRSVSTKLVKWPQRAESTLPSSIQRYTQFSSGIITASKQQDASRAFVEFISSPAARAAWSARGFEAP